MPPKYVGFELAVNGMHVRGVDVGPPGSGGLFASYIARGDGWSLVVDPGPLAGAPRLVEEAIGTDFIFITHVHLDHVGGTGVLWAATGATIYAHPRGVRHITDPRKLWMASRKALGWLAASMGPPAPAPSAEGVEDGGRVGDCIAIYTPGHAPHHVSLYCDGVLFPGDSIAIAIAADPEPIVVPTIMPPVNVDSFLASLDRMESLDAEIAALPHYGLWEAKGLFEASRRGVEEWLAIARRACARGDACTAWDVLRESRRAGGAAGRAVEYAYANSAALGLLLRVLAEGLAEWASKEG